MMIFFTRTDGATVAVNPDRVTLVGRYSGDDTTVISFSKDHFVIVEGDVETIADALTRRSAV